jgi:hypothetical protein
MADPAKRIENWSAKMTPERTAAQVTPQLTSIKQNAAHVMNDIVQMETQVRQVLNGSGVPTIQYPFYLCYGRELWSRIRNGMEGESLAIEAAVLLAKWVARGLTQSVLQDIRTDVFNVSAPVAP